MRTCRANPVRANGFVKVLEIAFAEVFAECIDPVRKLIAGCGISNRLAGHGQTGQGGGHFLMH